MTYEEWRLRYQRLRGRAENIGAIRRARIERTCIEAGLSPYSGSVLHDALIVADEGRPRREVSYAKARLARRIERSLFDAFALVDRWAVRHPLPR